MTKLFALALAAVSSTACAQMPATNPMPDGSCDMYVGLGVASTPRYQGAQDRERAALPVLQVQWSNGAFISGMRAGVHLSRAPQVEFGPLLELQPRRDPEGEGGEAIGITEVRVTLAALPQAADRSGNRLAGMPVIHSRVQGGGFLNYYLGPGWRFTSSLLYGAGNARKGMKLEVGMQRLALDLGAHRLALDAGVSIVNRPYNMAFFGVGEIDSSRSGNPMFAAAGGLKDARLGARWNWAWSPSWMLTSNVQATRLLDSARLSPLVERPTNLTVSTAIAYRF